MNRRRRRAAETDSVAPVQNCPGALERVKALRPAMRALRGLDMCSAPGLPYRSCRRRARARDCPSVVVGQSMTIPTVITSRTHKASCFKTFVLS
jgi:hypothetical protein